MTRRMKLALGSGTVALGLTVCAFTLTGCSGQTMAPVEEAKIQGMSPGEYLDSHDAPPRAKGGKKAARAKH